MATNEVVERDDIWEMDRDELHEHLIDAGFSEETSSVFKGIYRLFGPIQYDGSGRLP